MSPKVAIAVIVVALGLAAAAWMVWAPTPEVEPSAEPAPSPDAPPVDDAEELAAASIFFPAEDGWLHGVETQVPADDGEARVRALVGALLRGPEDDFLFPPLPEGASLDGLYFLTPETVALDFRFESGSTDSSVGPGADGAADRGEAEAVGVDDPAASPVAAPVVELLAARMSRMGSKQELLTVYSVVNTVVLGSDAVERVVVLIDGKQPSTLAGHVDLTRPLRPDPSWISAPSP
ncbi:MAG: GerMN domain-containing protein [Acidobacteriota bacterium]